MMNHWLDLGWAALPVHSRPQVYSTITSVPGSAVSVDCSLPDYGKTMSKAIIKVPHASTAVRMHSRAPKHQPAQQPGPTLTPHRCFLCHFCPQVIITVTSPIYTAVLMTVSNDPR